MTVKAQYYPYKGDQGVLDEDKAVLLLRCYCIINRVEKSDGCNAVVVEDFLVEGRFVFLG